LRGRLAGLCPARRTRAYRLTRALISPLVAMVMGFPVVPGVIMLMMTMLPFMAVGVRWSMVMITMTMLPIKAVAKRFRPVLVLVGMLVPVLMAVRQLLVLRIMVGMLMGMGVFVGMGMHVAVLIVFFHRRHLLQRQLLTRRI